METRDVLLKNTENQFDENEVDLKKKENIWACYE